MLSISQLSKSYNIVTILDAVSFNLNAGERLGLIGPNGCGKSTLLRILAGEETADSGRISRTPSDLRLGYLAQALSFEPGETLASAVQRSAGNPDELTSRLETCAARLATRFTDEDLQHEYDRLLSDLQLAEDNIARAPAILAGLGLDAIPADLEVGNLSGGQKTRLGLACVLLGNPHVLLLDEPTNHLDLDMLAWLENWLLSFRGAVLLVSHDRRFLDQTVTGILELNPETHKIRSFPGNYSAYIETIQREWDQQLAAFQDQNMEIAHLRAAAMHVRSLAIKRKGGKADSGDKMAAGFFANRSPAIVKRAKNIEARVQKLLTEERLEKPRPSWQLHMQLESTIRSGRDVLTLSQVEIGFPGLLLLENLNLHVRYGDHVALVGPNGCGKTTLLRTILGEIHPLAGQVRMGTRVKIGRMSQGQEELPPDKNAFSILQEILSQDETSVRSFLSYYLFTGDEVFTPARNLSFGERARLLLACLVAQGCNFLIMDEPINHLDIPSRARFEETLAGFEGTVLIVAHDRYFIEQYATVLWEVKNRRVISTDLRME